MRQPWPREWEERSTYEELGLDLGEMETENEEEESCLARELP